MSHDGPDMEQMPITSISAKRFVPTHDRYGLPIFRAGDHVKIIIEENGEAHEFAMPADEARYFAAHIVRLADGEDRPYPNAGTVVGLGPRQPR